MNIIQKAVSELKEYENNPRNNDEAVQAVAESIKQFGFKVPIIIDREGVIIAGHTRKKAAERLGFASVPCIVADDLTPEQIKAFRIADNKTGELAEWDFELLEKELAELTAFDVDMSLFGFDESLFDIAFQEATADDFDASAELETIGEPVCKLGDIWQLGKHRLMCGDSTDKECVKKLMNGNTADISFTSPPYNVGGNIQCKNSESKYANDSDNKGDTEYVEFLVEFTNNAIKHSKYAFVNIQSLANNKVALIDYLYYMKNVYADTMIWDKGFGAPSIKNRVMNSAFEYIHIFSDNATRAIGTKDFRGTIPNVLHIGSQRKNEYSDIHNATFSVEFASFFVDNFCNNKETVLDLFGGTGTTLIVCEQLDRRCYTMELDPKYCDVIIKRWEKLTGEKATLST